MLFASETLMSHPADVQTLISHATHKVCQRSFPVYEETAVSARPLNGGASAKQYFRVYTPAGTYIALFLSDGRYSSEEHFTPSDLACTSSMDAFVTAYRHMECNVGHVPTLHEFDPTTRLAIIQDVGDDTLRMLVDKEQALSGEIIIQLVDWIAQLQKSTQSIKHEPPLHRTFGVCPMFMELLEYCNCIAFPQLLDTDSNDRKHLEYELLSLAFRVAAHPQALIHRDFSSSNIMLLSGDYYVIDHQDCCLGSMFYDLASLLFDYGLRLDHYARSALVERFWSTTDSDASPISKPEFHRLLAEAAVLRLFKVAGRRALLAHKTGNSHHRQLIAPSLETAMTLLTDYPDFKDLLLLLRKYSNITGL
jgi:aminoglycoside/choline kinase family phosphotransferase